MWQRVHTLLPGMGWPAWNFLVWHVWHLVTDRLTALAWSFCVWHAPHVFFLVTPLACWATFAGPEPLPLWQVAHLLCATLRPACLLAWQVRHCL